MNTRARPWFELVRPRAAMALAASLLWCPSAFGQQSTIQLSPVPTSATVRTNTQPAVVQQVAQPNFAPQVPAQPSATQQNTVTFPVNAQATAGQPLAQQTPAQQRGAPQTFNMVPLAVTNVTVTQGQLLANGLIGATPFQMPLTLTAAAPTGSATCPVLNIQLAPVHLAMAQLAADTGQIALSLAPQQNGSQSGDLLCQAGTLLNGGQSLDQALGALPTAQLTTVTNALTQILNQALFIPITSSTAVSAMSCNTMTLSLGPALTTPLGVTTRVDNAANGAATLTMTASPSSGAVGQLLCNAQGAATGATSGQGTSTSNPLTQIAAAFGRLVG